MRTSDLLKLSKKAKEILIYIPAVEMYTKVNKKDFIANIAHTIKVRGDIEINKDYTLEDKILAI